MKKPRVHEDRGVAMGRSSVARHRWPDAQIEVTVAKRDLGKKLQREKGKEKREDLVSYLAFRRLC